MTNFKFYSSPVNGNFANPWAQGTKFTFAVLYVSKALEPSWYFEKQKKIDESSRGGVGIRMRVQNLVRRESQTVSHEIFFALFDSSILHLNIV